MEFTILSDFLPPEVSVHKIRLSKEATKWMEEQIEKGLSLEKFSDILFDLIEESEIIDAEIAYIACKAGIMTSKLAKVINLGEARHPAIRAYQALAYLFMNNFPKADELLEKAEIEAEKLDDILVLAEIYGIKIYLYNARYQFFQGVKIIQRAFEIFDKSKNKYLIDTNPSFLQWIRIAGAKSLLKLGNIPESLYTNKRALKLSNDHFFKSMALLGLGHCYDMVGKTTESIKYYKKALKSAHDIKAYNIISIAYNRLGMAMAWRMDKLTDGETYFSEAIISAEQGECFWLKEGPQWNLIALYRAKKDYTSAIHEIEDIIETTRRVGESRTELIALLNLGELLEEKGDLREAEKVREAADSLASLIGIDVEEFYESDEEDEDESDEEEDASEEYDDESGSSDEIEYDYYDTDESMFIDDEKTTDFQKDDSTDYFSVDENSSNDYDDSDDILRKFFDKKRN